MQIRRATVDDAPAIGSLSVRSWQAAYRGHMPDDFLDTLDVEQRIETWSRVLQAEEKPVFVSEGSAGEVTGFCIVGATRDEGAGPQVGEIGALYVDPQQWRTGIGRALLMRALDQARESQFDEVMLWVLEGNEQARAFYEAFGFVADGAQKDEDRWENVVVGEVRYRLDLTTAR